MAYYMEEGWSLDEMDSIHISADGVTGADQHLYKIDTNHVAPNDKYKYNHKMRTIRMQISRDHDRGSNTWEVIRWFVPCKHTETHIMTTHKDGQAEYDASCIGKKGRCKQCYS